MSTDPNPNPNPGPNPAPAAPVIDASTRLPDDHPLVKAYAATKTELADLKTKQQAADDATKTEAQKTAERIEALEKANAELTLRELRAKVAREKSDPEKGLHVPEELLSGTTEAELVKSADALIPHLKTGTPGQALGGNQRPAGPVSNPQEQQPESREDRRKRLEESLKR